MKVHIDRTRVLIALALAALAAASVFALTASNTVPATHAGSGSASISGYVITGVQYTLNPATPTDIQALTFTLDAPATTVKAKLVSGASSFYSCANSAGLDWSCATTSPQATVATADQLSIIAVS